MTQFSLVMTARIVSNRYAGVFVVEEGRPVPTADDVGHAVGAGDEVVAVAWEGVVRVLLPAAEAPRRLPTGKLVARAPVNWLGRDGGASGGHLWCWWRRLHFKIVEVKDLPGGAVEVCQDILELIPHVVVRRWLDVPGVEEHFGQNVHLCNTPRRPVNQLAFLVVGRRHEDAFVHVFDEQQVVSVVENDFRSAVHLVEVLDVDDAAARAAHWTLILDLLLLLRIITLLVILLVGGP